MFWDLDSLRNRSKCIKSHYKQLPMLNVWINHYTHHCTSSTSSSSQQYKKCSRKKGRAQSNDVYSTNTGTDFTEKLSLIYRFPGGNIFLHKREYFVTLVQRQTVEYISQQDERRRSRADTYDRTHRKKITSSLPVSR